MFSNYLSNEVATFKPTVNLTWINDHLKVENNPITKALASQGVVVDDLDGFNDKIHKAACSTARNPGGVKKGIMSLSLQRLDLPSIFTL